MIRTVRTACAHDCPDQCSLIATVEDGRLLKLQGDPDHPMTAGFACAKVNREHEMVHSPERVLTPLRRTGRKGEGRFAPVTWDAALAEIDVDNTYDCYQANDQKHCDTDNAIAAATSGRNITLLDKTWNATDNTAKYDQRDTITDAILSNQFTEPDKDHSTSGQ